MSESRASTSSDRRQERAARDKERAAQDRDALDRTSIRRKIQDLLREEDSRSFTGSLGVFLSGLGTCLVGGIVFATVMWLGIRFFRDEDAPAFVIGWRGWFGLYVLALGIALFLWERRGHGTQTVESLNAADHDPATDAKTPVAVPVKALANAWSTLLKWGPQSLLDGLAGLRGKWTARQNMMFKRAAQMLVTLAKYDGGIDIRYLVRPPEDMRVFAAAVEWLEKNMWVGRSSDGERLYISSPGRQKLAQRNLTPPQKVKIVHEG
jgi:hypothetical protein